MNTIKGKIKNIFTRYAQKSYSQEGEDMILMRLFEGCKEGFFVDVGAHHPFRFSNTYYFYKKGWRGINLDATPKSMRKFNQHRPHDINLERAISDEKKTIKYYLLNEPALNTFDHDLALSRVKKNPQYKIINTKEITTYTLTEILDTYLPPSKTIDFLTIDTEASDFNVLQSLDWKKYTPRIVLCEDLKGGLCNIQECYIYKFMIERGYYLVAKTMNTLIFKHEQF